MEVTTLEKTPRPDELVCKTARNDYMEEWVGEKSYEDIMGTVEPEEGDRRLAQRFVEDFDDLDPILVAKTARLTRKLMESGHFGPFEHPHVTFAVKGVSRITMAQLTRHRHVSFDVQSMRYVDFADADPDDLVVDIPEVEEAGLHGRNAGYDETYTDAGDVDEEWIQIRRTEQYHEAVRDAVSAYKTLLKQGVAPENARAVLPIGSKVNMTFTMNLRSLMHVADMRAAGDAQWEVRELTEELLDTAENWSPLTMQNYREHLKDRKNRIAP